MELISKKQRSSNMGKNSVNIETVAESAIAHEGPEGAEIRGVWGRQIEFILTCIGYAVGLGNVWRFPYLAYRNGGGAFLIPYVIMLIFVGVPIFFLELAFGQFTSLGPITIWTVNPLFKGLGFCMVSISAIICIYYNVIIAYCFFYFFASMTSSLPWITCDNEWNTCYCKRSDLDLSQNNSHFWVNYTRPICHEMYQAVFREFSNRSIPTRTKCGWCLARDGRDMAKTGKIPVSQFTDDYTGELEITNITESPSTEYFRYRVLQQSAGMEEPGKMVWQLALCLLLSWAIVFAVLIKGVHSLGKIVYFTATFPYVLLTILLVRGVTLPGSWDGIYFYLRPEWERLKVASVWSDAATQIFFSLSACSGGLITMASYNRFKNNCMRDSFIVPIINCMTSFYSGFVIFSVLGFMANQKGVTVDKVAEQGPGLAFVVYPEALARMDVAPLWAILFFLMMLTLGFSSTFAIVETVNTAIIDEFASVLRFKWRALAFRFCLCVCFFLLGLPMCLQSGSYLQNMVDTYIGGYPLLFVGLMEFVVLNWVYGYRQFARDIEMMLGRKPFLYFPIMWVVIGPIMLFTIIAFRIAQTDSEFFLGDYQYPDWAVSLAWLITAFPIVCVPAWFIFYLLRKAGFFTYVREAGKPSPKWGPYQNSDRIGHYSPSTANITSTESNMAVPEKAESVPDKAVHDLDDPGHSKRVEAQQYDNPAFVSTSNDYEPSSLYPVMPASSNGVDNLAFTLSPDQDGVMPEVEGHIKPLYGMSSVEDKEVAVMDERL